MKLHPIHTAWPVVLLGLSSSALAQGAPEAEPPPLVQHLEVLAQSMADGARHLLVGEDDTLAFVDGELRQERVVKGAPYCADAVHETVQWLPDAQGAAPNRIVRRQTSRLCRDGEGRTRQEVERGGRTLVYLRDPVSHENWVLDPQRKTARKLTAASWHVSGGLGVDAPAWREYGERMREWAQEVARSVRRGVGVAPGAPTSVTPPTPPTPPAPPAPPAALAPPTPVVIQRSEALAPSAGHEGREVEVRVLRIDGNHGTPRVLPPGVAPLPAPPAVSWRAQALAPRGTGESSPLPARDFDGVRAHGERTTWTIEAGKIGNEKPIQIVREVWTAPELMLTVATRDFDPRSGEVNYRLQNLRRGEPAAALMRLPADYEQVKRSSGGRTPAPRAPSAPTGRG